ncbi:MAG: MarR family transcriptional regulator [Sphingomonadaceae bacterium]|nr:MarR family transcriptional regulator [Sphingomonadaceae bacterium]
MDNIGYLLADAARLLRRRFDQQVQGHGVTGPQARLLLILNANSAQTQAYYADQMEVEPITLCRMVDRLAEAGLVERRPSPTDRRARQLFLTNEGQSRIEQLRVDVDVMINDMMQGLSQQEHETMLSLLQTIRANLAPQEMMQEAAHG